MFAYSIAARLEFAAATQKKTRRIANRGYERFISELCVCCGSPARSGRTIRVLNAFGGFVVFLIGMRINRPLLIHKWWATGGCDAANAQGALSAAGAWIPAR